MYGDCMRPDWEVRREREGDIKSSSLNASLKFIVPLQNINYPYSKASHASDQSAAIMSSYDNDNDNSGRPFSMIQATMEQS